MSITGRLTTLLRRNKAIALLVGVEGLLAAAVPADLASGMVPELVIRIPLEGLPRWAFEDGRGQVIEQDERMVDWLRSMGTPNVAASNFVEAFEWFDRERLEGRPPGRLYSGGR